MVAIEQMGSTDQERNLQNALDDSDLGIIQKLKSNSNSKGSRVQVYLE